MLMCKMLFSNKLNLFRILFSYTIAVVQYLYHGILTEGEGTIQLTTTRDSQFC
jgi:hypothetical protein